MRHQSQIFHHDQILAGKFLWRRHRMVSTVCMVRPQPHARELGISSEIIEAICNRRAPRFAREDERFVDDITTELNMTYGR
jgi:hypothetical protein